MVQDTPADTDAGLGIAIAAVAGPKRLASGVDPAQGTFTVRADALAETFLKDCGAAIQQAARDKTAQQSLAVLEQQVQAAA